MNDCMGYIRTIACGLSLMAMASCGNGGVQVDRAVMIAPQVPVSVWPVRTVALMSAVRMRL